jgi:F-type H+-transporting ATPase subunit delta
MKNLALVKKYADGLARALEGEREYASVGADVRKFLELFLSRADLRQALVSPFVNARKKAVILDEILPGLGMGPKAYRFLALLLHHKRMGLLPEIAEALPEAWSEKHGVVTLEVASALPLTEAQIARLTRTLEAAEKKPVRLVFKADPGLVGGLTVRKGNIVYDASVEGELSALKERLGHEQRLS